MSHDDENVYFSRRSGWPPPADPASDVHSGDPARYERSPYEPNPYEPNPYEPNPHERNPYEGGAYDREPYEPDSFDPLGSHDRTPRIIPTQRGDGPRHRRSSTRRRRRRPVLRSLLALLLLVAAGGVALWLHEGRPDLTSAFHRLRGEDTDPAQVPASCAAARLRVVAAPDIAPVVRDAARALNPGGGDCGPVAVTAEEPSVTVGKVSATPPDVWIPSSRAWLRIAGIDGARFSAQGRELARTPIVVAASADAAKALPDGDRTRWSEIVTRAARHQLTAVTMPDPLRSTVGLLSVLAVRSAMQRTTDDEGIAQLRALTLRSRLADADADPAELLGRSAAGASPGTADKIGVFPVTEQQLFTYRKRSAAAPLAARYPDDGMIEADYPLAVSPAVAADPERKQLTDRFANRMRSPETGRALTAAGFRLPAGTGGDAVPEGLPAAYPKPMTLPGDPAQVLGAAMQWSQYRTLSYQVLLLVDASGSMNARVPDHSGRSTTKAALLRESGVNAAQLFGEETSVGMWYFGTPKSNSPAFTTAVPFGPIESAVEGNPRRAILAGAIGGYRASPDAGTPLYRTILDGVTAMRARAKPDTITMVVVLTDGHDEDSRFAMTRPAFLARLADMQDADRPVPIFGVGYGPDADMETLRQLARTTGGQATAAVEPADLASAMAKIFLAAHAPN